MAFNSFKVRQSLWNFSWSVQLVHNHLPKTHPSTCWTHHFFRNLIKMTTPKYRLVYFDVRALAEPIRWIFQYTGTPFVDERILWDYPKWFTETKAKFSSTVGQMPVLHEEGNPAELTQAQAISRYLAKKFNLHGDDDWQNFRVDEVVGMVYDLFIWWRMMLIFEKDPERKKYQKAMTDAKYALYYAKWNKMLEESGGDYILGKKLTHADFWLANFISIWDDPMEGDEPIMPPGYAQPSQSDLYLDLTKGYPALRAHKERIHAIPQIKAWIGIRHKTIA